MLRTGSNINRLGSDNNDELIFQQQSEAHHNMRTSNPPLRTIENHQNRNRDSETVLATASQRRFKKRFTNEFCFLNLLHAQVFRSKTFLDIVYQPDVCISHSINVPYCLTLLLLLDNLDLILVVV